MELLKEAQQAAVFLNRLADGQINRILEEIAGEIERQAPDIIEANKQDLAHMDMADPKFDRLKLTEERICNMAADMRGITRLPSPLNRTLRDAVRPNGMHIRKITVPIGVVGVIYEARPNVTTDVFSLCLKSGNVCVLKGSRDAYTTNGALVNVIHRVLDSYNVSEAVCTLLPPGKDITERLLQAHREIDLIIPRGSQGLINYVREHARVPVIETGAGICHTYFDEHGDLRKGRDIIFNAKTRRVSVCNALDCLLIHAGRLADLPYLCEKLAQKNVVLYADAEAYPVLAGKYPQTLLQHATPESFGTEFLDYKMSIRTVQSPDIALEHIKIYSSRHSEAIISEDRERIRQFQEEVDAACVYANVSTAFTDGAQFGLGAEIGISTQKLHARGPMGLEELTSYKYVIDGDGQTRD